MGLIIGNTTLDEVSNGGNTVLEAQGSHCGVRRIASVGGRSASDVNAGNVYVWDNKREYNHPSGGLNTGNGQYVAPWDGIYMFYVWVMIKNNATWLNDYYDLEINGGFYHRVYGSNGSNVYREFATGVCAQMSAGDNFRVRSRTLTLYGTSNSISRFSAVFLG